MWKGIIEMLSVGSIACNMAVIYFTGKSLQKYIMPNKTNLEQFMYIIMVEHILFAIKMAMTSIIKD